MCDRGTLLWHPARENLMVPVAHVSEDLRARYEGVRSRIATLARQCGRAPEAITLVAVSKTHPVEILKKAIAAGITDLGESRVQEADTKIITELGRAATRWHLIGHLQSNKAHRAVKLFDIIHSLDSISLARRLDRFCEVEGRDELPVLIQVDLADEATKSGVPETELVRLVEAVRNCSRLRLQGLMTVPPFLADTEQVRPFFRQLRDLRDELQSSGCFGVRQGDLSMGMSHDYEVAIEEGATILRIGTAIFGERVVSV